MVGRVIHVTPHMSLVDSVMKQGFSVTGRDLATDALGVIKGQGEGVILDNVVLSDKLQVGDMVITKGDLNENGVGVPPDLVVGKISSIDRRPSNLFQSAEIQSLIDLNRLSTVFVLKSIYNNKLSQILYSNVVKVYFLICCNPHYKYLHPHYEYQPLH